VDSLVKRLDDRRYALELTLRRANGRWSAANRQRYAELSVAYVLFLRNYPCDQIPEFDRRLARVFTLGVIGIVGLGVACFWVAFQLAALP
jgi:hypothetical protein